MNKGVWQKHQAEAFGKDIGQGCGQEHLADTYIT